MFEQVKERIHGRIAMSADDAAVLERLVIEAGNADTCEIGTLYGGSAILAALAKQKNSLKGLVYAIDPLTGYYGGLDTTVGGKPGRAELESNLQEFDVHAAVVIVAAKSHPWPVPCNRRFGLVFVDGDHSTGAVYQDFVNASEVTDTILFHDYHAEEVRLGIVKALENSSDWMLEVLGEKMAVMRRMP